MRPLLYSEIDAATKKIGWVRTGENIKYYKNGVRYSTEDLFLSCCRLTSFLKVNVLHKSGRVDRE